MYSFDLDLGFKELGIGKLSLNSSAPCEREWGSQYASSRRQQCTSCQDFSRALDPIKYPHLVGGLEHFFFPYGIILPIDFHIFQRGWNHQPAHYGWIDTPITFPANVPVPSEIGNRDDFPDFWGLDLRGNWKILGGTDHWSSIRFIRSHRCIRYS